MDGQTVDAVPQTPSMEPTLKRALTAAAIVLSALATADSARADSASITNITPIGPGGYIQATFTVTSDECAGQFCGWYATAVEVPAGAVCSDGLPLLWVGDYHDANTTATEVQAFYLSANPTRICVLLDRGSGTKVLTEINYNLPAPPPAPPAPTPAPPTPPPTAFPFVAPKPPVATPAPVTLTAKVSKPKISGKNLTLALRLSRKASVSVQVRRGSRIVANSKARSVRPSTSRLKFKLNKRVKAGRYTVRVRTQVAGKTATTSAKVTVR